MKQIKKCIIFMRQNKGGPSLNLLFFWNEQKKTIILVRHSIYNIPIKKQQLNINLSARMHIIKAKTK